MQRAYDQVVHDVCIQNLHVVFCLDRAGVAGADGPTHHGAYDIAYMRCLPNMILAAPMNEQELRNMMYTAQKENSGPFTIRYPRGNGVMPEWETPFEKLPIGKGRILKQGSDIAILSFGTVGNHVVRACEVLDLEGVSVAHYDMRFAKPLDETMLHSVFKQFGKVITVEDGCLQGGFGSAILEFMSDNGYSARVSRLGIPDRVIEHGEQPELYKECGYDAVAIADETRKLLNESISVF
jgi:1-deoxy-D-xylulose-5-phosphate synthase